VVDDGFTDSSLLITGSVRALSWLWIAEAFIRRREDAKRAGRSTPAHGCTRAAKSP
jgi:hypothetical protein